jgi:tetratricopeptide (TPR) repeat protein
MAPPATCLRRRLSRQAGTSIEHGGSPCPQPHGSGAKTATIRLSSGGAAIGRTRPGTDIVRPVEAEGETADVVARRADAAASARPADRARAVMRLALSLRSHGRFAEAADEAATAERMLSELGATEPAAMCRRLHDEMRLAQARADHDRAIALLGDARNAPTALAVLRDVRPVFVRARVPEAVATCAFNLAYVLHELSCLDDAVEELQQARSIYASLGRDEDVAGCNQNLGVVLADMGRYAEAEQQLQSARTVFVSADRAQFVAQCDANLALVHHRLGDGQGAMHYEHQARREGLDRAAPRPASSTY